MLALLLQTTTATTKLYYTVYENLLKILVKPNSKHDQQQKLYLV